MLTSVCIAGALVTMSERWPSGQRSGARPVRVHASEGWGQPAVSGASVFYLSKAHELFAIGRDTGAETWRRSLRSAAGTTAGSAVVVSGGLVIAGDGDVFGFDAVSGTPRWRTVDREGAEPGRFLGAVAGSTVFTGSATGWLLAQRVDDGRERWRLRVGGNDVTVFAPVADAEIVVAAFTDFGTFPRSGGIVAADTVSGRQRWLTRFPRLSMVRAASAGGPPSLAGDLVSGASTDGTVYLMSRSTGEVQWTIDAPASAPVLGDGSDAAVPADEHEDYRVVKLLESRAVVSSLSGVLTAVDLRTRETSWRYQSPQDGSNGFGFTVAGDLALVPFASGRVAVVDVGTGQARSVIGHSALRFDWPPAVAGNCMYLTAEDGLYEVDLN